MSKRVYSPSPLNKMEWPPASPTLNEHDGTEFARALYQMWWRIPEPEQSKITQLVCMTVDDISNVYALLGRMSVGGGMDSKVLQKVKDIIYSTTLLTVHQKRINLLNLYARYHLKLKMEQRELLAGIVAHMALQPISDSPERVISSGLANGCDFDAFEMFEGLLRETVKINKG